MKNIIISMFIAGLMICTKANAEETKTPPIEKCFSRQYLKEWQGLTKNITTLTMPSLDKAIRFKCPDGHDCYLGAFANGGNHGSSDFYIWAVTNKQECKLVWDDSGWLGLGIGVTKNNKIILNKRTTPKNCNAEACRKSKKTTHQIIGSFEKGYTLIPPFVSQD